jgi:hypothetical protein
MDIFCKYNSTIYSLYEYVFSSLFLSSILILFIPYFYSTYSFIFISSYFTTSIHILSFLLYFKLFVYFYRFVFYFRLIFVFFHFLLYQLFFLFMSHFTLPSAFPKNSKKLHSVGGHCAVTLGPTADPSTMFAGTSIPGTPWLDWNLLVQSSLITPST